jgi:hypothetical protein
VGSLEVDLPALEQSEEEAGYIQCQGVEDHDVTEPFVCFGREDAYSNVSYQTAIVKVLGLTQIGYQNSHFHQSDDRSEKQLCRHAHLR